MAVQAAGDRFLLNDQADNLELSQRIVRDCQATLTRSCYLLTGDEQQARQLAVDVLLAFFHEMDGLEHPDDRRRRLLAIVARLYRDAERVLPTASGSRSDQIEDESERLLTTLERLDPTDRLALVLREYNRLDEESLANLLEVSLFELRERLGSARQRLREAVSAPEDASVRGLLDSASSGAPKPNLWPLVEEPLREQERRRRARQRRLTWSVAAGVILLVGIGAPWIVAGFGWLPLGDGEARAVSDPPTPVPRVWLPTSTPQPSPTPLPAIASLGIPQGDIPSVLIIDAYSGRSRDAERRSFRYDLATNNLTALSPEDKLATITISPDGRWALAHHQNPSGGSDATFQLINVETNQVQWSRSAQGSWVDIAFAGDRLYLLEQSNPSRLLVLDVETGEELASHEGVLEGLEELSGSPVEPPVTSYAQLYVTPAGDRLWITLAQAWEPGTAASRWIWRCASYNLPDLTLRTKQTRRAGSDGETFPQRLQLEGATWTPDGAYLATVAPEEDRLLFYSPDAERQLELGIPFSSIPDGSQRDLITVPSNTGRYLYLLARIRREVAVVDLLAREVLRVAPIDTAGYSLVPLIDVTSRGYQPRIAISPGGSQLYVANAWTPDGQPPAEGRGASFTVTVLNTMTWRVVDQWELPGEVFSLIPIDGGGWIAVFHAIGDAEGWMPGGSVTVFEGASGEQLSQRDADELLLPDWVETFWVDSLYSLYRQTYDRSPAIDGTPVTDVKTVSSLPRVRLETEIVSIPVGVPVGLEVRFEDPVDGDLLTTGQPDVRFGPASIVSVTLRHERDDVDEVMVVMRRDPDGVYRGMATLEAAGEWRAAVTVTPPEGDPWSVDLTQVLTVSETLAGTDGRRYMAMLDWEPTLPASGEPFTFTARFVDTETRELIPEDVDLVDGLPEEVVVLLPNIANNLQPISHGVYQWEGGILGAGSWPLMIRFQLPETRTYVYLTAGFITIGE